MFAMRVVRSVFGLGLLGLVLTSGQATAQPREMLVERILEKIRAQPRIESKSDDMPLHRLLTERYNVSVEELKQRCEDYLKGLCSLDKVIQSAQGQLTAHLELLTDPQEKVKALEFVVELLRWYEGELDAALKQGIGLRADLLQIRRARLTREIEVLRIKQGLPAQ